jgi:hypothetical protein
MFGENIGKNWAILTQNTVYVFDGQISHDIGFQENRQFCLRNFVKIVDNCLLKSLKIYQNRRKFVKIVFITLIPGCQNSATTATGELSISTSMTPTEKPIS